MMPSAPIAVDPIARRVLSGDAVSFVSKLQRRFNDRRRALLADRERRRGTPLGLLAETAPIREARWRVAPIPAALKHRTVEITGPADPKMIINALNSGANVFMADFEDSFSPVWSKVLEGQAALIDAVQGTLRHAGPDGREYWINDDTALLMVRPRGWHLDEVHLLVDGAPVSASLVDFGLFFFHNAWTLQLSERGPFFYLPKLESAQEAALWRDVFAFAEETIGIPAGTIRATVLIETLPAAFQMEEILHELRAYAAGLNAGRWDYLFSCIKNQPDTVLPDRGQLAMTVPFLRAYTDRIVATCKKRGAQPIGGMAAFVPNRRDAEVTTAALAKVREDKEREAGDGFIGTWVAHPDLVPIARSAFSHTRPAEERPAPDDATLLDFTVADGTATAAGFMNNVTVALRYLTAWLDGTGAVAINNLMEDVATAEIARAQIWQWIQHRSMLDDGKPASAERYALARDVALAEIGESDTSKRAATLLDSIVLTETFTDFLTIPAYRLLAGIKEER